MQDQYLWWRDGVIYQIYPRSFVDSNGDGIGDINGIRSKLDYLANLGVAALWLSPIYPSPDVDFGYDITDFTAVDPRFGTMEDFDILLSEAHQRGICIILDLVLNHTSDQHPWFIESRKSLDNPYRDWFIWRPSPPKGGLPNNWASVMGGPGWEMDPATGEYYFHMFYKEQPDLNWRNPQVRQALMDVFRFWLERGVDGFRLDVFNAYIKHVDLPNNPPKMGIRRFDRQQHVYDISQPEMIPLLAEIRTLLDAYPGRYAVGETYEGDARRAATYCAPGLMHAAFNFEMLKCRWRPGSFMRAIQTWDHALDPRSWPTYVLNNHDTRRSSNRLSWGENDERLKVAAALLLTLRGTPFMYYGEEIGMRNISLARSQIMDRVGLRYWPLYTGRDGCRSPMQWDSSIGAGFSSATPWLPLHKNYTWRNVTEQQGDPTSLFNFYKSLIALRKEHTALRSGMFQQMTFGTRRVLAYLRQTEEETILVALNFSRFPVKLVLGGELGRAGWQLLLSSRRDEAPQISSGMLSLLGSEACILRLQKNSTSRKG